MKILTYRHFIEGGFNIQTLRELTLEKSAEPQGYVDSEALTSEAVRYSRVEFAARVASFTCRLHAGFDTAWNGSEEQESCLLTDVLKDLDWHNDANFLAHELGTRVLTALEDSSYSMLMCRKQDEEEYLYMRCMLDNGCCGTSMEELMGPSGCVYLVFQSWGH